ncbi:MAG: DUF669 domain-containing protein [candidate division Zixibacteria bacterium]|nr:DUF669 domain-containing protein [candidate division Zixibacteria bacterium]
MPKINFAEIPDVDVYEPIPDGDYLCMVADIEEKNTTHGDEMWQMKLKVAEDGEYLNRVIFDNIVFSKAAEKRVKLICSRFGLDTSGNLDLKPEHLIGKQIIVTVITGSYEDAQGVERQRNEVPFAGYTLVGSDEDEGVITNGPVEDDDIPF